jgi:hypothetical protein
MCTLPYLSPDGRDQDEIASSSRGPPGAKRQHQGPSWHSASVKLISHFIETNHSLEPNEIGNSDPRLGRLLILNTTILPRDSDSWSDPTSDLRPGDLVMIKSPEFGSRFSVDFLLLPHSPSPPPSRIALGIVHSWNPDSLASSPFGDPQSEDGQAIRIVVCVCKADPQIPSESSQEPGQKRSRGSDLQEAIDYMNTFGGWLQEGDVCPGSVIELLVIRSCPHLELAHLLSQQHDHL